MYEGQANCDAQLSDLAQENEQLKSANTELEISRIEILKVKDLAVAESKECLAKLDLVESQYKSLKSLEELTTRQKALESSLDEK